MSDPRRPPLEMRAYASAQAFVRELLQGSARRLPTPVRETLAGFESRNGDFRELLDVVVRTRGGRGYGTVLDLARSVNARRDRALADFEDAARELLALCEAPPFTLEQTCLEDAEGHAVRIRAALAALLADPARKRKTIRLGKKPRTRADALEALQALGFNRAQARAIFSAIAHQ